MAIPDKNIWKNFLTKLVIYPLTFFSSLIIAKYLGPADRGVYSYILIIVGLMITICAMGFANGMTYYLSSKKYSVNETFFTINIIGLGIGLLSWLLVYCLWYFNVLGESAKLFSSSDIFFIGLNLVFASLYFFNTKLLQADSKFTKFNFITLLNYIIRPLLLLLFVWYLAMKIKGIYISLVLLNLSLLSLLMYYFVKQNVLIPKLNFNFLKDSFKYGVKSWIGDVAIKTNARIDQLILGAKTSAFALGIYSIAVLLAELLLVLPDSIEPILFNKSAANTDSISRIAIITKTTRILFVVSIVISILMCVLVKYAIIPWGLGEKYELVFKPFLILIPGIIALIITKMGCILLNSSNMALQASRVQIVSFISGFFLYLLLIPIYSSTGAAIASSISYLVGSFYCIYILYKNFRIPINDLFILTNKDFYWIIGRDKQHR